MNRRIFLTFLVILAVVGGFWLRHRSSSYKNFPPTARGEWVAFGDSLTAGYGASEGHDYPTLLSQKLGVPIRNLGISGNTTRDGLARLPQALQTQPRVVLLCLGGNDGLQSLSREQMISNLGSMIDQFQQAGSFVVLIGVHSASIFDSNGKYFERLAKAKQAYYIPDILDGVLGSPSLMSDQVHPNEAGYEAIAERFAQTLRPLKAKL